MKISVKFWYCDKTSSYHSFIKSSLSVLLNRTAKISFSSFAEPVLFASWLEHLQSSSAPTQPTHTHLRRAPSTLHALRRLTCVKFTQETALECVCATPSQVADCHTRRRTPTSLQMPPASCTDMSRCGFCAPQRPVVSSLSWLTFLLLNIPHEFLDSLFSYSLPKEPWPRILLSL